MRHRINADFKVIFVVCALLLVTGASGQQATSLPSTPGAEPVAASLTREEELHLLEARQAQLTLDHAETEMKAAKVNLGQVESLFTDRIVTIEKFNEATQQYGQAVVNYEQAKIELEKKRLDFLKNATLVTVVDAQKYRGDSGEVLASIKLRNDSNVSKARIAMSGQNLSDQRLASLLNVDNVVVTLKGNGATIVGDPFQQIVPELATGQEVTLVYRLLDRNAEHVTVSLSFLGTEEQYDVFLKKEGTQDLPIVSSTQYSQIGQLGSKILYDLDLERLAKTEKGFSLIVLNLPVELKAAFLEPSSKAMLTQVRFTEELSKQSLYFEVSIPEKLSHSLVDKNISFYIMITHQKELKTIFAMKTKHNNNIPPEEIAKLKGSRVELILIPRGVGKLEKLVPNLFKEVEQGEPVELKFNVMNTGTLELRRVAPKLDLPLDWEGEVDPPEVEQIAGDQKVMFTAHLRPPADVSIGEYTVKMQAEGYSGVEVIEATDKDFTVRISSQSSITGTAILVGALILLVVGIAVASIKISRR